MQKSIPLCVDLDGTLSKTDLLHESVLQLIKINFLFLFYLPFWLIKGKAFLKRQIAQRTSLNYSTLPYNSDVIALINAAKLDGRMVVLATASQESQALGVANHLGLFDTIEASTAEVNLASSQKAKRLVDKFGKFEFDYVGNSRADLAVWAVCRKSIVVSSSESLFSRAKAVCSDVTKIERARPSLKNILKAIRVHQWLKNALVFVPVLVKHGPIQWAEAVQALLAFVAFSLCASAVYVLNDLLDLEADRQHKSKRRRHFASGNIPISVGAMLLPALMASSLAAALQLPPLFFMVLVVYFIATNLYSLWLKRQVIVDIMLLAMLYTTRIVAGGSASGIDLSFWLLAFSIFIFFSLGVVKRYTELRDAQLENRRQPAGRGYAVDDLPILLTLGVSSGFSAVVVLALYVNNPDADINYKYPQMLWLAVLAVLYWIVRVWMKTHRGEIHEDPVVFAATDKQSWAVVILISVCFFIAQLH
ncbi:UbiA family prenyltransferase [Xylophilus sp. GOD-11R]|uniref:UbiA family prenyltransferase n=1 Tax=Xylophilus sp. GOD-11R TaxID=3089814 RepID=UPI00298CF539|nr:UbiA family prenyltransferase [Xylophilus sp. GOD-11R]WPB57298.1 UbiA family prenyltransferase [Xylophilus sp. GOD-11R]